MRSIQFWNKAIEHYCSSNSFDSLFISVSESSLLKIYSKYIQELEPLPRELLEKNVSEIGGVEDSYYISIREAHQNFTLHGQFSFLRFSFFTIVAFNMESDDDTSYWRNCNEFSISKNIELIPQSIRTEYVDGVINNLTKYCLNTGKRFININVYGRNSNRVNVGRIYAHSVFQGTTIKKVITAIYKKGYAYLVPVELYSELQLKEILIESRVERLVKFFDRNQDTKEIIHACLKLWLKNWRPNEEEENKVTDNKKSHNANINLVRLWVLDIGASDEKVDWVTGFVLRSRLGNEGKIFIDQNSETYIDLDESFKIQDDQYLYIIKNNNDLINMTIDQFDLKFNEPKKYSSSNPYALKRLSGKNHQLAYFYQYDYSKVTFSDEQVFIASKSKQESLHSQNNWMQLSTPDENRYFLYRVRESITTGGLSFSKINNDVNIKINGVSDGRKGVTAFLSSFPIQIDFGNLDYNSFEIKRSGEELFNSINEEYTKLDGPLGNVLELQGIKSGNYELKIKDNKDQYVLFPGRNVSDAKEFEIVDLGERDVRTQTSFNVHSDFEYHEFNFQRSLNNIIHNWIVLYENDEVADLDELSHQTFDFCFRKDSSDRWFISLNDELVFASIIDGDSILDNCQQKRDLSYIRPDEYIYLDSSFIRHTFQAKPCYDFTVSLPINEEMYIRNKIPQPSIWLNCFCFELIDFDDSLRIKYPNLKEHSIIFVLTNFVSNNNPERLLKMISQEVFPFKFLK